MDATASGGGTAKAALLAVMVFGAAIAVALTGGSEPAGASELERFGSCEELRGWMGEAQGAGSVAFEESSAGGDDMATAGSAAPPAAPDSESASRDADGVGTTNVIVDGIDELDRVEVIDDRLVLATGDSRLHLVDIVAAASLASVEIPLGAQVSYDPERSLVWAAGSDGQGTRVSRIALTDSTFEVEGSWRSDGWLLTGRRSPEGFHVVMTEGFSGSVPFADGPVACDEVLHPSGPSMPEATLIATLPTDGEVVPSVAAEIVGAGQLVHLTSDQVFVATPIWDGPPATSLHRFDLATLTHTGSGRVEGSLLNEFAMSADGDHLRVAVTLGGGGFRAMPIEPGIGDVVAPAPDESSLQAEALNEVVVLDTTGDLDVVGRTPRFGLPGETLHGIRFVGATAYAVTFLQTDPFYVIDLADPSDPRVVGEVKLPGFSSYLHPVADGMVVGFGPDGESGAVAAKLFDVSNPAQPEVVTSIPLGDESAVVWDHHAYLSLGEGRFAVPSVRWEEGGPVTTILELEVSGRSLQEVSRTDVAMTAAAGERLIRTPDRWAVHSLVELVVVPDAGAQVRIPLDRA